jgi:hypothetical protein
MGLTETLQRWRVLAPPKSELVRSSPLSFDDWVSYFTFGNTQYGVPLFSQTLQGQREHIDETFSGLVQQVYHANGVVFAVEMVRLALFSEARFGFREIREGRPGRLFGPRDARGRGYRDLQLIANPWPGGTTADLLRRVLLNADFGGVGFVVRRPGRLSIPRPDWMTVVVGSPNRNADMEAGDLDAQVIGYIYHPGGRHSGRTPVTLLAEEVAYFAPIPDPQGYVRGVPWMAPVIRDIAGDSAMTNHKLKYFEHGATPNMAVQLDADISLTDAREWIELFRQDHEGAVNAYRTLFLGGGAKPVSVGNDLQQIDFKSVQGASETRIAAAGGVPPVIVGLSEGLSAATYSNYSQARRRLADGTLRPLWRDFANSLSQIIDVPADSELWYDDRDIPFLQEDVKDAAEIMAVQATAIRTLTDGGFTPESVVDSVTADDLTRLEHTQLLPVQLQPPTTEQPTPESGPAESVTATDEDARSVVTFEPVEVRCDGCGKLAAKRTAPGGAFETKCRGCGGLVAA